MSLNSLMLLEIPQIRTDNCAKAESRQLVLLQSHLKHLDSKLINLQVTVLWMECVLYGVNY